MCLFSGRVAPCATVWASPERRVQAAMLRAGVGCAVLARSARSAASTTQSLGHAGQQRLSLLDGSADPDDVKAPAILT